MTGTPSALPMVGVLQAGLGDFNKNMWTNIPFHDWPYWSYLGIGLASFFGLWLLLWFYNNFIR